MSTNDVLVRPFGVANLSVADNDKIEKGNEVLLQNLELLYIAVRDTQLRTKA